MREHPVVTAGVSVDFVADAVQRGPAITVRLGVRNEGAQPVRIKNPFELIQFLVLDRNGFPKHLPRTAPSLLINAKGRTGWKLETPFPIVGVQHNERPSDPADLDKPSLDLGAGDSYEVTFAIDRFMPDPDEVEAPAGLPTPEPVPSGEYSVQVIVNLIDEANPRDSRIVHTPRVLICLAS